MWSMELFVSVFCLFAAVSLPVGYCSSLNYAVEHSFDGRSFSSAGSIIARSEQKPLKFVRSSWTAKQKKSFQDLLDRDGFYTLRLIPNPQAPSSYLSSSVRGRCLLSSGIKEELQLHMDDAFHVVALQYLLHNATACIEPAVFFGEQQWEKPQPELPQEVGVTVHFAAPAAGVFVTENPEQGFPKEMRSAEPQGGRIGKDAAGGEGAESKKPEKDERTWLQKNWLFVMVGVMMVLQVMLKAAGDPTETGARPAGAPGAGGPSAARAQRPAGGGRRA